MIADDIYSLYFIYNICDTMSVTAIKRSVCTVFTECVGVSVVDSFLCFSFFSTVGVLITVVAIVCPVWRINFIYIYIGLSIYDVDAYDGKVFG